MPTPYRGSRQEQRALNAFIKLTRAAEAVNDCVNAHLRDYKLTVSQFGVLEVIYHLGPLQTGELGQKILKSSGNMTLVIDNLEKRGLVQRQQREDDRRCIDIHLTAAGEKLIEEILPQHVAGIVETFSILSPAEQDRLDRLCRRLGRQERP
jgi:MarR family 2-MHQ and catechol resistance regulon transcriptional repressor